jgi:hypothetical protein
MDTASVPLPGNNKEVARAWIAALRQATALRAAQRYEYPLVAGPRIRAAMTELCPLLATEGIESPLALRAIAAGVSIIHPAALALLLAGADLTAPERRRGRKAQQAAQAEAWLRRQLSTLEGPR